LVALGEDVLFLGDSGQDLASFGKLGFFVGFGVGDLERDLSPKTCVPRGLTEEGIRFV